MVIFAASPQFCTLATAFAGNLIQMGIFDQIANSILPDGQHATMILEEESEKINGDRAFSILQQLSPAPIAYEILKKEFPAILLFRLSPEVLREAVLKLTENGFSRFKAINCQIKR